MAPTQVNTNADPNRVAVKSPVKLRARVVIVEQITDLFASSML